MKQTNKTMASLLPSLLALSALVEAGHGLVGRTQLHHQEERLLVVTERTRRLRKAEWGRRIHGEVATVAQSIKTCT